MDEPPEREISPGIFVTDFRSTATIASTASSTHPPPQEQKQPYHTPHHTPHTTTAEHKQQSHPATLPELSDLNQLAFDLHQLHNSIDHLIASNAEMVTAMDEDAADGKPQDDEYAVAIRENMQLIDRKQSEAAELQALIDSMLSGHALDRSGGGGVVVGGASSAGSGASSSASSTLAGGSSGGQDEGGGDDGMYL